jgi:hypothetical protein
LVNLEGTRLEGLALRGFLAAMERCPPRGLRGVGIQPRDEFIGFLGTEGQEDPPLFGRGCRILDLGRKACPDQERLLKDSQDFPRCPVRFARIDEPILCFTTAIGMTDGKTHSSHPLKPSRRQDRSPDIFFDWANMCRPVLSMPNAARASLLWLPSQWLLGVELRINTRVRAAPLISRPKSHTEVRSQRSL